ncbi:MAG TPA: MarR family winged helix-turn-helix transcriptional regulator [Burkholderiales bacterium]|nr:MarR family winged helix-turn-helix transcriptional regulator [Burkholderiales bacterium]
MPTDPALITGCTCDRLRKLTRRITQHYDARLAPAGLRVTQYSLLAKVGRSGPVAMSALAELLEMDRTTLTRNLKPLADSGLVVVSTGRDARARVVTMTPAGHAAFSAAREHWRRAQDEVNRALGAEQVAALHGALENSLARFKGKTPAGSGR